MSGGEQNALDLTVGPWQGPLVLSLGFPLRRETSVLPALSLEFGKPPASWWQESAHVPAHRVQRFVSVHAHERC